MIKTKSTRSRGVISCLLTAAAVPPSAKADTVATNSTAMAAPSPAWKKPVWSATRQLGLDLGGKILNANFEPGTQSPERGDRSGLPQF